ncbi:MAG: HNH endonuclease [Selenomonas sp.]|nr:HNH endonuclease [Selenomonas sp.]
MQEMNQIPLAISSPANIKEYFSRYILEVKKLSSGSEYNYKRGLKKVSQCMKEMGLVEESIYEIGTIEGLDAAWQKLKSDSDFSAMDRNGHRMYSSGFNCYRKFATGDMFHEYSSIDVKTLDAPMKLEKPVKVEYKIWKRSGIMRTQTVVLANYACDIDHGHATFTAASTGHQYMEAHHIIPLKLQERFSSSLDVYANLISLCPICHRKIHLGIKEERRLMIDDIYEKRKDRLVKCGFVFGKEEFEDLVMGG